MKNLSINKTAIESVLLSGIILVGSAFGYNVNAKSSSSYELKSPSLEEVLENEDIKKITELDEVIANGDSNVIELDKEFRKHASQLTQDNYVNDRAYYEENFIWLNKNYNDITKEILFDVGKTTVADAVEEDMNSIKLYPVSSSELNDPIILSRGRIEVDGISYNNKSKQLEKLINEITNIQAKDYYFKNAKELLKSYDNVVDEAILVMSTGANVHNNNIEEKYSKSYSKKHIMK